MSGINILLLNGIGVPCSTVLWAPFPSVPVANCAAGAEHRDGHRHAREVLKGSTKLSAAQQGHRQLANMLFCAFESLGVKKNRWFSWLGELLGNLHAVCSVPVGEKDFTSHSEGI